MNDKPYYNKLFRIWRLFVIVKFGTFDDLFWRIKTHDGYAMTCYFAFGKSKKLEDTEVWRPWKLIIGPLFLSWAWIPKKQ